MLKRIVTIALALILSMSTLSSVVFAEGVPTLIVDGRVQNITPAVKVVEKAVVAPMQPLLDVMQIAFSVTDKTIVMTDREYTYTVTVGSKEGVVVNGAVNKKIALDVAPFAEGDVIYLPVKGITEGLGYKFTTEGNNSIVSTKDRSEYWFKYPTMAEQDRADETNSRISRGGLSSEFSWGILAQKKSAKDEQGDKNLKKCGA